MFDYSKPFTEAQKQELDDWYFIVPEHKKVWEARYALKDSQGQPLEHHVYDSFVRITEAIVPDSAQWPEFIQAFCEKKLLPAGRQWAQAGTQNKNLSNCFVLPLEDDSTSISQTLSEHFQVQRGGGGTGFNFSELRPHGAICKTAGARSSGPLGFLEVFSRQSANIQQGGQRSGANLGMLEDRHPSLIEFINFKANGSWSHIKDWATINNSGEFDRFQWKNYYPGQMFNLSIGLSDFFMNALTSNPDALWGFLFKNVEWFLWEYKIKTWNNEFNVVVSAPDEETASLLAREESPFFNGEITLVKGPFYYSVQQIWDLICKRAWEDGCPGIIFWDRMKRYHNGEYIYSLTSTNPCGEVPLPSQSSCTLSSIPLPPFVEDSGFNLQAFSKAVVRGIQWLDYVVDATVAPTEEITQRKHNERRIGLSVTGVSDALMLMGMSYASEEGRLAIANILETLRDSAYRASIDLAKTVGAFPVYSERIFESKFIQELPNNIQNDIRQFGLRNITLICNAPIGSTGTAIGYTTGCEPPFGLAQKRNSRVGSFIEINYALQMWLDKNNLSNRFKALLDNDIDMDFIRKELSIPDYFIESHKINAEDHIKMLAVFTKFNDQNTSKTINLPNTATVQDVDKAYRLAWDLGCKSVTVYRDGSKTQILETVGKKKESSRPKLIVETNAPSRPKILKGELHLTYVKGNPWLVTVGMLEDIPYELFAGDVGGHWKHHTVDAHIDPNKTYFIKRIASGKYDVLDKDDNVVISNIANLIQDDTEKALTRMISTSLRHGVPLSFIIEQLSKTEGSIVEFSKVVSRVLRKYVKDKGPQKVKQQVCLECNTDSLIREEGCMKCTNCGWSKCG